MFFSILGGMGMGLLLLLVHSTAAMNIHQPFPVGMRVFISWNVHFVAVLGHVVLCVTS